MNRARVWTNSFTMAEHIQREAIAREGPLYNEELFHLLRTVIQGEALSHDMQFAHRLRDRGDEELGKTLGNFDRTWLKNLMARLRDTAELVTTLGNFVAAAYREPDLAEELDRADEAVEAEVDEETPSPSEQRQLLGAHVNLGHPAIGEFCGADGVLSDGQNDISNVQSAKHDRCRELGRQQLCRNVTVLIKFVASTLWKFGIRWIEKTQFEYRTSYVMGHVTTREHAGRT